jgi:glycosyltransferase involved in cell wall biosynthesis
MKKLLIVSYHFPPDAAIGAVRPAKFAKYLPACGWEPTILTVKESYYPRTDESRAKDLQYIQEIYRVGMLPHPKQIYLRSKTLFHRRRLDRWAGRPIDAPDANNKPVGWFKRLIFSLEHLPDDKQVWIPQAVWKGIKIINARKVDCILTSGPPMSCHLIGLFLHKLTGLKWVVDFRDPWSSWKTPDMRSYFPDAVDRWLEKTTVWNADKVVTATHRMQEDFIKRYPSIRSKTEVILNGYDPEDYPEVDTFRVSRNPYIFIMTHVGTMYQNRSAKPFLVALADLIRSGNVSKGRIRVNFIGNSGQVKSEVAGLELTGVVRVIDPQDYEACLRYLYASDVLLLFAQGQPLQIPGKFYDYIAVRKPILIFTEDGATADLAKQINRGMIVDSCDSRVIAAKLQELYKQFEDGKLTVEKDVDTTLELRKSVLIEKLMAGIM